MMEESVCWDASKICQPLRSLEEIEAFVADPPAWRTLCQPLTPHSEQVIRNSDLIDPAAADTAGKLQRTPNFCHYDPKRDIVLRHDAKNMPKTLVCHDMANGYHDDCLIDGSNSFDNYIFYNWAAVDIFCYFSHHLVTVPPLGWINVAHQHGVKVIGTLITEWSQGAAFWEEVLSSEEHTQRLISSLVAIAKTLHFEGWLLNVENKVSQPSALVSFVSELHRTLHGEVPHAELIWYDSVTIDGDLHWQNKLNHKNKAFFDACDGIFTNYSWSEGDIEESAAAAGGRRQRLYIGVDVWGRNFYGGGMFNTQQAVRLVHSYSCSVAIFAPAWSHEARPATAPAAPADSRALTLTPHAHFTLRDRALWGSLWRYLHTRLPCRLPFSSSFCTGHGTKRRMYGEVLSNSPWYNLRHMQYQPNSIHGAHQYMFWTENVTPKQGKRKQIQESKPKETDRTDSAVTETHKIDDQVARSEGAKELNEIDGPAVTESHETDENSILKEDTKLNDIDNTDVTVPENHKIGKRAPTEEDVKSNENDTTAPAVTDHKRDERSTPEKDTTSNHHDHIAPAVTVNHKIDKRTISEENTHSKDITKTTATDNQIQNSHEKFTIRCKSVLKSMLGMNKRDKSEPPSLRRDSKQAELQRSASVLDRASMEMRIALKPREQKVAISFVPGERACITEYLDDSFMGGTCLLLQDTDSGSSGPPRTIRLLHCDFLVRGTAVVCLATKTLPHHPNQYLKLLLHVQRDSDQGGRAAPLQLVASRWAAVSADAGALAPVVAGSQEFRALQVYLLLHQPGFYVPQENSFGWDVFYFEVPLGVARITSIGCELGPAGGALLLGHLGLCERPEGGPQEHA